MDGEIRNIVHSAVRALYQEQKKLLEDNFSSFTNDIQKIYKETPEGNGQKWLMIDLEDKDKKYEDIKKIIKFRANKQ